MESLNPVFHCFVLEASKYHLPASTTGIWLVGSIQDFSSQAKRLSVDLTIGYLCCAVKYANCRSEDWAGPFRARVAQQDSLDFQANLLTGRTRPGKRFPESLGQLCPPGVIRSPVRDQVAQSGLDVGADARLFCGQVVDQT